MISPSNPANSPISEGSGIIGSGISFVTLPALIDLWPSVMLAFDDAEASDAFRYSSADVAGISDAIARSDCFFFLIGLPPFAIYGGSSRDFFDESGLLIHL